MGNKLTINFTEDFTGSSKEIFTEEFSDTFTKFTDTFTKFTEERPINDRIIIGVTEDKQGITDYKQGMKFFDSNTKRWEYESLKKFNKEKNYIECIFSKGTSLLIFKKNETCSESIKSENIKSESLDLHFIFESSQTKFSGKIEPEYKIIGNNCVFDKILSL